MNPGCEKSQSGTTQINKVNSNGIRRLKGKCGQSSQLAWGVGGKCNRRRWAGSVSEEGTRTWPRWPHPPRWAAGPRWWPRRSVWSTSPELDIKQHRVKRDQRPQLDHQRAGTRPPSHLGAVGCRSPQSCGKRRNTKEIESINTQQLWNSRKSSANMNSCPPKKTVWCILQLSLYYYYMHYYFNSDMIPIFQPWTLADTDIKPISAHYTFYILSSLIL